MLASFGFHPPSEWRPLAASVAFGMSVPILFYTTYRVISNYRCNEKVSLSKAVPSPEWSCQQVCKCLAARSVSTDGVLLLAQHGVNGKKLPHLTTRGLAEMGLDARDRRIIMSFLSEMEVLNEESEANEPEALASREEMSFSLPSHTSFPLDAFLSNADHFIMEVMHPAPPESDLAASTHRAQMASRLYKLLDHFHCLPMGDQKAAMLPLARQLHNCLAAPTRHVAPAPPPSLPLPPAWGPPAMPLASPSASDAARLVGQVRPLHDLLDRFAGALATPEAQAADADAFLPLAQRMTEQIARVQRVAGALPPALRDPLAQQCDDVLRQIEACARAKREGRPPSDAPVVTEPPVGLCVLNPTASLPRGAPAAMAVPVAIARLAEVYKKVSDPERMGVEPVQRQKLIEACLMELRSIDEDLKGSDDQQAIHGREMSAQIYNILQQLHKVSGDEYRLSLGKGVQDTDATKEKFSKIKDTLESLLKTTTYLQLDDIPQEMKQKITRHIREKLVQYLKGSASLPDSERDEISSYITCILDLLPIHNQTPSDEARTPKEENTFAGGNDAEKEEEEGKPEEEGEPKDAESPIGVESVEARHIVAGVVEQIKSFFLLLHSDRFMNATAEEKRDIARTLLNRTNSATDMLRSMGCSEPLIQRLTAPLVEVLMKILEKLDTPPQSSHAINLLMTIQREISSSTFQQKEQGEKLKAAGELLSYLRQLEEAFQKLPPSEQASEKELLASVKRDLEAILSAAGPKGTSFESEKNEPNVEAASTEFENPQDLMRRIEEIINLIQSKKFNDATSKGHLEMVISCISELKAIQQSCDRLHPEIRQSLAPIVTQMVDQLKNVLESVQSSEASAPPADAKAEAAAEAESSAEREKLFQMVAQIVRELRQGLSNRIKLSDAELIPLWNLLELMDTLGKLSPEEMRLRGDLETALQLACQESPMADADPSAPPEPTENAAQELPTSNLDDSVKDVNSFICVFRLIQHLLDDHNNITFDQLVSLSAFVEKALAVAAARGVVWQDSEEAIDAVRTVQEGLERIQELVNSEGKGAILDIIQKAVRELEVHPPESTEKLKAYLQLYEDCAPALSGNPEAAALLNQLRTRILEIGQKLNPESYEDAAAEEGRLSKELYELSYKLREPNLSKDELDECEQHLNTLDDAIIDNPDFRDVIAAVREQAALKRQSLELDEESASEKSEESLKQEKAEPYTSTSGGAFKEDDIDSAADQERSRVLEDPGCPPTHDGIPGGLENELTLLPKIETCILKPTEQFVATCKLFDIQSTSKVLLHLSASKEVERDPELRNRVNAAKVKFLSKLQAFEACEEPSQDVQASHKLQVTVEDTTDESGLRSYKFVVFMPDEADNYSANVTAVDLLQKSTNATSTKVHDDVVQKWVNKSKAIIVLAWEGGEERKGTALSELVLLHEVLTKRYGFDTMCLVGPNQNAASVERLVKHIVSSDCPSRLFLFYYTPITISGVRVPQAMTFHDDSVLEHSKVLELTAPVERVVVVHSMPRRMEVMSRLDQKFSPSMSVFVTSAAAKEVLKVRCLLYEGLFTPIIAELLYRDEGNMLCPEDLLNYTITAMTRLVIEFGSFLNSEATSMGYFVPFDK